MLRLLSACGLALFLAGCATLPAELPQGPEGFALAPQPDGPLFEVEKTFAMPVGPDVSGFRLLASNEEALRWRLALIDSARHSLDLQYYVWWGDEAGSLLIKRLTMAADRGVRVRIIVDDLTTMLADATNPKLRDGAAAVIDAHPNIEIRLFNPWRARSLAGRLFESVLHLERVNQRMHNKLMIADNRAAVIGGRNVGNEYFGLSPEFNFQDLDTLGIGPVARQASGVFDRFWNSELVVPAGALGLEATPEDLEAGLALVTRRLDAAPALSHFAIEAHDWDVELAELPDALRPGTSRVYTDSPEEDGVDHLMPQAIRELLESAEHEVLIANAYIIPGDATIEWLKSQTARGVRYRILTNSLASHDVPAVNAHYKLWRRDLLRAGAELYETRPDAAVQPLLVDTPPVTAEFMGLHMKAVVVDGKRAFIGSMNFDPRSWRINSEMGVIVESTGLAADLQSAIARDMQPENAWQVTLAPDGQMLWTIDDEVWRWQPARSFWQRVEDLLFMAMPKELY